MRDNPLVSIVIPVYNGENFLKDAIESALSQSYPNKEILVINDGSIDRTKEIAEGFGDKVRYFEKENGGVASALNEGLRHMRGEYFSWLSHDDLYELHKLSRQMAYLSSENFPADTIVYCNYKVINEAKRELGRSNLRERRPEDVPMYLAVGNDIHGCTMLIPKRAFDRAGEFDPTLAHTQDLDMWYRLAKFCRFKLLPDSLVISRSHAGQHSRSARWTRTFENDAVSIRLLKSALKEMRDRTVGRNDWKELAQKYWRRKLPRSASYAFMRWMLS